MLEVRGVLCVRCAGSVRGVLLTFETVVMYGHFDGNPGCVMLPNRRDRAKIFSFCQGGQKWCYVNQNHYITYIMLVLINVCRGGGLMDGGFLVV